MLNVSAIIALLMIMVIYVGCVLGVRRYQVIAKIRTMRKMEFLGVLFCFCIIFFGILMKVSREGISLEGGIITEGICRVGDVLFAGNTDMLSLFVLIVTVVPAYVFQLFTIYKFDEKINSLHTMLFYYAVIYAFNLSLYKGMSFTVGNAILYFLLSVIIYYVMQVIDLPKGKKDYLFLGSLGMLAIVLVVLEGMVSIPMLITTVITLVECVILSWYLGKSVILRNVFRRLGTVLLIAMYIFINQL